MILYRTDYFDAEAAAQVAQLAQASNQRVVILIDERRQALGAIDHPKISVDREELRSMGLFTPDDFAWRCGDYGFYLARRRFPEVETFWMIEHDVRITGAAGFFTTMDAHADVDLVAADLRPAEPDWWWYRTALSRDAVPYRCLFPAIRLTRDCIDMLARKRIQHSRNVFRRVLWPNDEVFVATTIANAGCKITDLNGFGRSFYSSDSFSYHNLIDGDDFPFCEDDTKLYHPVLTSDRYTKKQETLSKEADGATKYERITRKLVPELTVRMHW